MPDSSSLEADKLKLLGRFWEWLVAGPNQGSLMSVLFWIFILIIILILSFAVLSWAVGTLLEGLAKVLDAYKKSGLPLTVGKEKKAQVRRRQQFCKVLNGDLLTLAKAENWNDQYFTDLDAEVEAEGRYYANLLNKMLRRQSQGLRKVSSLISAIELSTEQALLIVGQPGSGKSVALRHLAHQFAEQGIRSGDPETIIPLYLNLKELSRVGYAVRTIELFKHCCNEHRRLNCTETLPARNQIKITRSVAHKLKRH